MTIRIVDCSLIDKLKIYMRKKKFKSTTNLKRENTLAFFIWLRKDIYMTMMMMMMLCQSACCFLSLSLSLSLSLWSSEGRRTIFFCFSTTKPSPGTLANCNPKMRQSLGNSWLVEWTEISIGRKGGRKERRKPPLRSVHLRVRKILQH